MGDLQDAIEQMEPADAARARADALAIVPRPNPWSVGAVSITVTGGPRKQRGDTVEVDLSVTLNGQPVPLSNPFRFTNPPIAVHDGTFRNESVPGRGGRGNVNVQLPNFVENPAASLRAIIQATVMAILDRRGLV